MDLQVLRLQQCHQRKKYGIIQSKAFNNSILDIFGFTAYMPAEDAIVVVFRSTVSLQNWIVNLDATQVLVGLSRCHTLAARDVRSIKASTMPLLGLKAT